VAIFGRFPAVWLTLTMLVLPVRAFIATRHLEAGEIAGALLGLVLWVVVPARWRVKAALAMMLTAILLREMTPFYFLPNPMPFTWIPFYASFGSDWQSAVVILLRKTFDYGVAVWLLRAVGSSYGRAACGMAAALLCLELVQRYVPGHVPETTDAVLTLLMAFALRSLSNPSRAAALQST
jgi:hypothetical protein